MKFTEVFINLIDKGQIMDKIIEYIKAKYHPSVLIIYGSFADGSNNANSDFDALAIADVVVESHDNSFVDGMEMDLFIYPEEKFKGEIDWSDFPQLYDGKIVVDTDHTALKILAAVKNNIDKKPQKTQSEKCFSIEWCEKMMLRIPRNDAEGLFRLHWLLVDSLEIYFDLIGITYFGPKKGLRKMSQIDKSGYCLYEKALHSSSYDHLQKWIEYLRKIYENL